MGDNNWYNLMLLAHEKYRRNSYLQTDCCFVEIVEDGAEWCPYCQAYLEKDEHFEMDCPKNLLYS